jgi:pimeloyl-ACP methyl ester carboxylesterase
MDYAGWANGNEYYGNFFNLCVDGPVRYSRNVPLYVYLHALNSGSGMPMEITYPTTYALYTNDPNNTWWFGTGSNNYTERRLQAYIDAVIADPRFSVDTNRVYLRGQSMGGKGTLTNGLHFPNRFAALIPFLAPVDTSMTGIITRTPSRYMPPITDFFGSKDSYSDFGMGGHRMLYMACAAAHQGVWGNWLAVGHQPAGDPNVLVKGSFLRFRKDEAYPAFTHSNKDWNYGLANPNVYDSVGLINAYFDWTCSLHHLNLKNDSLVDCADSFSITMNTPYTGTVVDVTPRNLQRFAVAKGTAYNWKIIDVATDAMTASGKVTADTSGLITLTSLSVSRTGTRLVILSNAPGAVERAPAGAGLLLTATPNPFARDVRITVNTGDAGSALCAAVYDLKGARIVLLASEVKTGGTAEFRWNAGRMAPGVYLVRVTVGKVSLQKKLLLQR